MNFEWNRMRIKSVYTNLSLAVFGSLFAVTLSPLLEINQRVFAQEVATSCPLPAEIAVTFLGSKCKKLTLLMPQTFFRYYSNETNKKGRFLTTEQYQISDDNLVEGSRQTGWPLLRGCAESGCQ